MSLAIRLAPETVRTLGFAAIGVPYTGIGTVVSHPIRILMVQNLTDESLMFSFNGLDDHFPLAASGTLILDVSSNKGVAQELCMAQGSRLYVKQLGVPTTGSVYFTVFYGQD